MKAGVILNPVAGGGMRQHIRTRLEAVLAAHFSDREIVETQGPGDGRRLALAFAAQRYNLVIAVGGDGTASEVVDGLVQAKIEKGRAPAFALLPWGGGADFARGLGMTRDKLENAARIAAAEPRMIDVGRVTFTDGSGALASRYFLNISSLGLSGPVLRAVERDRGKGRLVGATLYYWRSISEFLRYRFKNVRIIVDDGEPVHASIAFVAACNGRYFAGGMMVAPEAKLDDGLLDIVIVRSSGKLGMIRDMGLIYGGRHRSHHAVTIMRGRKLVVEPLDDDEAVEVEADGEVLGRCPTTIEIVRSALALKC